MNIQPVLLREVYTPQQSHSIVEAKDITSPDGKSLKHYYMQGLFLQGNTKNYNERIYPAEIISQAVESIQNRILKGETVCGEADHPESLTINIDRISHVIEKMWMQGNDGWGRLRILPSVPCGAIIEGLLKEGIKLGVSSRGAGNVDDYSQKVTTYDIITVDIVVQPSAPDAYPTPIYESIFGTKIGKQTYDTFKDAVVHNDTMAIKHTEKEIRRFIQSLKLS